MKCDVDCYRVNYSKEWLERSNDDYHIDGFPCYGAVLAINLLCDEVVALRKEVEQRADNMRVTPCLCDSCQNTGCRGADIPFKARYTVHACDGYMQS